MLSGGRGPSYQAIKEEDVEIAETAREEATSQSIPTKRLSFFRIGVLIFVFVTAMAALHRFIIHKNSEILMQSMFGGKAVVPFKVLLVHPDPPTSFWGDTKKPLPTGAFWTNLVVRNGDGPIGLYPYGVKTLDSGVQASYGAYRRQVSSLAIIDPFVCDIQISSVEPYTSRAVERYDSLSVTMTYNAGLHGKFKALLVKSSPFLTVKFDNATPQITSPMQILSVDPIAVKGSIGSQYIVTLGNYQKWLVYCSDPAPLIWKENSLIAPNAIRGVVRMAILPNGQAVEASNMLLGYVHKYPISAVLSFTHPTFGTSDTVQWQYNTVGTGKLLMLALPHQTAVLTYPSLDTAETKDIQSAYGPIWCIKGKMQLVVGETWKLQYSTVQVCVCICMKLCVYIYIHMYIHIQIHTHNSDQPSPTPFPIT
jgi:endoglucanase Acf2